MADNCERNRKSKLLRWSLLLADLVCVFLAAIGSYFLISLWASDMQGFSLTLALWAVSNVALAILLLFVFHLYHIIFASVGFPEAVRIVLTTVIVGVANVIFILIAKSAFAPNRRLGLGIVVAFCLL